MPATSDRPAALPIVDCGVATCAALEGAERLAYTAANRRHIGPSPLLPTPFNATRGPVKFYDFARMGAAGVYSEVVPFAGFVRDGVDGLLLPNEPARWIEALVALAGDAPRRTALAVAARAGGLAGARTPDARGAGRCFTADAQGCSRSPDTPFLDDGAIDTASIDRLTDF